jgi:polar amino acid transport system substrate-binding protein
MNILRSVGFGGGAVLLALAITATPAIAATTSTAAANPNTPASPLVRTAEGRLVAPDIGRIIGRGELVVAMPPEDSAPFYTEKGGVLSGTDVDLARRLGKELGVPVRFDRSGANVGAVVDMVATGGADLAIGRLERTVRRSQMVLFSTPYMTLGHALLINRVRLAELSGERALGDVLRDFKGDIGVMASTSWEDAATRNFPQATVKRYPSWAQTIDAVRRGEVAAAYHDELAVRGVLQGDTRLALVLRSVTFNDAKSEMSVLVGVRDTTLLSFVNEVIGSRADKPAAAAARAAGRSAP